MSAEVERSTEYFSVEEIAECIGTVKEVVYRAIRCGRLDAIKEDGRYRIKGDDAERWMANRRPHGRPRKYG